MESLVTDLVKTQLKKLINVAKAELRFIFCFTCIANEFEEERVWLEAKVKTWEQRVKVAARREKDIQVDYFYWKEKADELIKEDIITKQTCFFGLSHDCKWRYEKGKELSYKIEEIKRLTEKGEEVENIELPCRLPDVERDSSKDYISFQSRESKYKELLNALKDDNNYIIVLQGMEGIGKTTLTKELGKELKQSEQFAHVIHTTMSFSLDTKKIQDDIAGSLGLKLDDCNDSDRPKKLRKRLTNGEKILLIMDDVRDEGPLLDFDLIGIPKQDNHEGCSVLITTPCKRISNIMGCNKMIELNLLDEEETWTMFQAYAGITDWSPKIFITIGRQIVMECKQLPVAIAVISSHLKDRLQKHVWDATLISLKKPMSMENVDDEKVGIYKCLKSSYDHMKNEKAKGLFLLSSLFPKDKEIHMEVLTRLGIGTGLFRKDYDSYDDGRNRVVVAKNKLIDLCLWVGVDEGHVKMHELVREAVQWITIKEIQRVNLSNKDKKSPVQSEINIKYLFYEGKDTDLFSGMYDGSKLETLIVDVERDEVSNSFFENFRNLQVLYFLGHDKRPLSLPHSVHSLTNIRSILVDGVDLGDISVLENLQSLETLDLVNCIIDELPHEIAKLGKLTLLNLEECVIRRNDPFKVIERCSTLQELYFIDSFNDFCQEITLLALQRYHIRKGWSAIDDSLSKYVSFKAGDDKCFFSKATFNYWMQTTKGLQLNGIKNRWKNLVPEIVSINLGMKNLVELRLSFISQLQCLIDTIGSHVPNVLPNLVILELEEMENLEQLFNGSLSVDFLKNLEELSIKKCKMFQSLFNCALNLCNLKTVTLRGCPLLVNLFPLLTSWTLVLLEKLEIADCEGLKNIIIDDGDKDNKSHDSMFPKLKRLYVQDCRQLKYIFGHNTDDHQNHNGVHLHLPALECLQLYNLPSFVSMCPKHYYITFPQLKELKLKECSLDNTMMKLFYIWKRARCLPLQSNIMCNVKEITLYGFPKIKSVFILSITSRMLVETLKIKDCHKLKHIVVNTGDDESGGNNNRGNVFPKLKRLCVKDCMQLKYIFGYHKDDHPNHNEIHLHLPVLQYLELCNLPNLVAMCPKQYHTTFSRLKEHEIVKCSWDSTIMKVHDNAYQFQKNECDHMSDVRVDSDSSDDGLHEVEHITHSANRQVQVRSKKKSKPSLAKAERDRDNSVEATSRVTLDCYVTECVNILNEMEDISHDAYGKALEKLMDPYWREVFIAMSDERKRGWVLRL